MAAKLSKQMRTFLAYFPDEWGPSPRYCPVPTFLAIERRGLIERRSVKREDPNGAYAPLWVSEVRKTDIGRAALGASA